jgi:hypothetical protein
MVSHMTKGGQYLEREDVKDYPRWIPNVDPHPSELDTKKERKERRGKR